ncbi:MAG: tetratricopeptide repeat protein [Pseudomonadota bacterium]
MRGQGKIYSAWMLLSAMLLLNPTLSLKAADKTPTLSQKTYRTLQSIEEMLDAGQSDQALRRLEELIKETAKRPYAQAIALQSLAHTHIDLGDYKRAIPYLKRSLELQALPDDVQQRSRYNLAQLYMATEKFSAAVELLNHWFANTSEPTAEAYVMLGSAYLQLQQYKKAITPLRQAIKLSNQPNENWYQSLLGAYHELKNYKQCVKLLHSMLKLFPDRASYWRQLSGMELMRKNNKQALAVMELAYLHGHLSTERDLLNLAQLYSLLNAPYKAAQLRENEIQKGRIKATVKSWEQTANAWYQAKEMDNSITAFEKAVARGGGVELRLRLAQLYLETRRWSDAQDRLREILKEKDSKWRDRSWLLLGIACYEGKAMEQARSAFSEALKFKKTQKEAEQWLAFLNKQA